MSESEGKRDLVGLAKSIDALFTSTPGAPTPPAEATSLVVDLDTPSAGEATFQETSEDATFDAPLVEESGELQEEPSLAEPPVDETTWEEAELAEAPPEAVQVAEAASEESSAEEVAIEEVAAVDVAAVAADETAAEPPADVSVDEPGWAEADAQPAASPADETARTEPPADVSADEPGLAEADMEQADSPVAQADSPLEQPEPPVEQAVEEVSDPIRAGASVGSDDDEPEPGPLDLAVDAYIAGQLDKAEEIASLASGLLEDKEVDPIARAVFNLTLAAGSPPDASVSAVADSIISPVVLGRLARHMGSERDEQRRQDYYAVCLVIGEDMAVAIRNDLADSTDRLARRIHYDALIAMGDASRTVIEEMAVDDNRFLVRNAVAILGEIGGDSAVELVTSALANPDAHARREALLALAKLGDEEAGQLVVGLLEDPEAEVRMAAAIAAGELKVERALRSLISMLEGSSDPDEHLHLIRALGQLGDPGAVASIEKHAVRSMFSRPPTAVRIASYRALNSIGTPHARRLLNQAVSDKDPDVKAAVKDLLHMR